MTMATHNEPDAKDYYPPPVDMTSSDYSSMGPFAGLHANAVLLGALRSSSRRTRRAAWMLLLARLLLGFVLFGLICLWAIWRS